MALRDFLDKLCREATQPKFHARIKDDRVLDKGFVPRLIEPNKDYFEIRLSEMFLRDKREYWRGFVPLGILESDFLYGDKRRSFTFLVSSELLREIQQYIEGEQVEYFNTRVAGPIPYLGDDVGLFLGLFRSQTTNLAETLFSVLSKILSVFDVTKLSEYLNIAGALNEGLSILLNMNEVEYRIGNKDVFSSSQSSHNQLRDSYLAYVNCNENEIGANNLWVKEGRLYLGDTQKSIKPLRDYDYCLVRIQGREKRDDYTTLPFDQTWRSARKKIASGDQVMAVKMLIECCQQIADSPDLTQEDAYYLQLAYTTNFHKEVEFYNKLHRLIPQRTATVSRGVKGLLTPQGDIQKTVYLANRAGVRDDVLGGLLDVSENWSRIPHLEDRRADLELTDNVLNEQIQAIAGFSKVANPDPKALADAIAVAALSAD